MRNKKVKRVVITDKKNKLAMARFHDLFNEASEEETKMIQEWSNKTTKKSTKKYIVKWNPINYIEEQLDNENSLRYFNYSGRCKLYKNGVLVETLYNNSIIERELFNENLPWFTVVQKDGTLCIENPSKCDTKFFDDMLNLLKSEKFPPSKRKYTKIVRWKDGEKHARMPKR